MKRRPFSDPAVEAKFDSYPKKVRAKLAKLRELIFTAAAETGVGEIIETLKWGQPAYLTARPRTGSTVRIDALKGRGDRYAVFFHCQTTLVSTFRDIYRDTLAFEGNRAIVFRLTDDIPEDTLKHCISLALTYHSRQGA